MVHTHWSGINLSRIVYGSDDYFHHSEEQAENQKVEGVA